MSFRLKVFLAFFLINFGWFFLPGRAAESSIERVRCPDKYATLVEERGLKGYVRCEDYDTFQIAIESRNMKQAKALLLSREAR